MSPPSTPCATASPSSPTSGARAARRLGPAHDDAARRRAGARAQLATLERLTHERATADEIGGWLDELEGDGELDELDRDIVRLARRDWDAPRRVPADLAAELAQAAAEGQDVWQTARAADDFAAFAPALRRNLELARAYAACFDDAEHPYDALLADYDFGLTAARIERGLRPARRASCRRWSPRPPSGRPRRARRADRRPAGGGRRGRSRASASTTTAGASTCRAHPFTSWVGPQRHAASRRATRTGAARVGARRDARVRPRPVRAPDRRPSSRARTSATARRCRCTSRRASCGRTTSGATARSRR